MRGVVKSNRKAGRGAILAVGTAAAMVAAHAGTTLAIRSGVDARLASLSGPGLGVSREAVEVDPWSGRVTVRGLALASAGGPSLRVGALRLSGTTALVSPALAAGNLTLENLTVSWNKLTYTVPKLDIVGSSVGEAEIRELFNTASTVPMTRRLAAISAESVSAPELRMISDVPDAKVSIVYRDIRMMGIAAGVIKSMAASAGAFASEGKAGEMVTGTTGPMTASQLDLPWIVHSYAEPAAPGETEPRLAYAAFGVEKVTGSVQSDGKTAGQFAIARMSGRDIKIRPSKEPWFPLFQELAVKPEAERKDLPPADRARLVNAVTDMMEAMQVGLMEASDLTFSGGEGARQAAIRIGRMAYNSAQVGKPNEVRVEGFEVKAPDGSMRIGTFAHSGWSFRNTFEGLRKTVGQVDFDPSTVDPRMFIPEIGTFSMRDVDFDVPDTEERKKNPAAPNVRIGLKGFELQATEPLNGIPTVLRTALDRLTLALPQQSSDDSIRNLVSLGYKDLDLSFGLDARWREADEQLSIGQFGFQGVNMGSFGIRGSLGNVSRDIFTGDGMTAQFAAMAATVKDVTLSIDNKGLFEKILDSEAKKARKTPEAFRKELSQGAGMLVPAFLGPSAGSKAVLAAVQKFIAKPNRLTITARAKDPAGLGAADLIMGGGSPQAIMAKVDVTATAD